MDDEKRAYHGGALGLAQVSIGIRREVWESSVLMNSVVVNGAGIVAARRFLVVAHGGQCDDVIAVFCAFRP